MQTSGYTFGFLPQVNDTIHKCKRFQYVMDKFRSCLVFRKHKTWPKVYCLCKTAFGKAMTDACICLSAVLKMLPPNRPFPSNSFPKLKPIKKLRGKPLLFSLLLLSFSSRFPFSSLVLFSSLSCKKPSHLALFT